MWQLRHPYIDDLARARLKRCYSAKGQVTAWPLRPSISSVLLFRSEGVSNSGGLPGGADLLFQGKDKARKPRESESDEATMVVEDDAGPFIPLAQDPMWFGCSRSAWFQRLISKGFRDVQGNARRTSNP